MHNKFAKENGLWWVPWLRGRNELRKTSHEIITIFLTPKRSLDSRKRFPHFEPHGSPCSFFSFQLSLLNCLGNNPTLPAPLIKSFRLPWRQSNKKGRHNNYRLTHTKECNFISFFLTKILYISQLICVILSCREIQSSDKLVFKYLK